MSKRELEDFLVGARAQTYAGASEKSDPLLPGTVQYDFADRDYSYRDVYNIGNGRFMGLETVFKNAKPIWSMSYFGDFAQMSEEQTDTMLRRALKDCAKTARLYYEVEKEYGSFVYTCSGSGTIDQIEGSESITVNGEQVYVFYYAGGWIG